MGEFGPIVFRSLRIISRRETLDENAEYESFTGSYHRNNANAGVRKKRRVHISWFRENFWCVRYPLKNVNVYDISQYKGICERERETEI
jgi:hypothetical protein